MNEALTQAKKNYKKHSQHIDRLEGQLANKTKEKSSDFSFLYVS